jgi:hypothetical protein
MAPHKIAEFRRAVRHHLAERPSVSQCAETIHRFMHRENPCEPADVQAACTVLTTLGQLDESNDPMGGPVKYYRITAKGILDHEAGR